MISALVDLLGNFYASNDLSNVEVIARSLHAAVPGDQISLQFLGLVYYRTGRVKDALRVFNNILRKRKSASKTHGDQDESNQVSGASAAAVCYQEATRQRSDLARMWYDLGSALQNLRKFELAIPAFRNALVAQPTFTNAMLAIGRVALRTGDLTTAEDGFSRLRALQPNNVEAYRGLGQIYRKRHDFATARACFVRVRMLRGRHIGIDNLASRRKSG